MYKPFVAIDLPRLDINKSFLGCEKLSEIAEIRRTYPRILKEIIGIILEELLRTEYRQFLPDIRITENLERSVRDYRLIDMGGMKLRFADTEAMWWSKPLGMVFDGDICKADYPIVEGLLLISKDNCRLKINIDSRGDNIMHIMATVTRDNIENALKFFSEIEKGLSRTKGVFDGNGQRITIAGKRGWEEAVLSRQIIETIESQVLGFMKEENRAFLAANSIPIKRGLLFYGPPGNGKTLTGKIIANQTKVCFILCTNKNFVSGWRDDDLIRIYKFARVISPSIVFIEDIDLVIGENTHRLGTLLQELDGIEENENVITIATTNHPEAINEALGRPGRFDIRIEFPNPDFETRIKLLKLFTKNLVLDSSADLGETAEKTEGFSCAAMKEVVTRSLVTAYETGSVTDGKVVVGKEHLERAAEFVQRVKGMIGFTADAEPAHRP
ncbi:hypothetical protein AUJ67_10500 [Candidatus Desantisbacteria bacterium CG1_02_49_89]|nr:MAG: hypothetical protein AUJ67_10500 [Candidatus Desantisbacteria bacterium CG1_02_49_89]